ncbi:MoxR-like ATPase [Bradyrhizobium sp. AZCC 1578]
MSASTLPKSVDGMLELLTSRGYLAERSLATVAYLSLRMGRPLFLEGEAGVGKTEIAKVLSAALGRKLIRLQCYEGLDVASAVYEWSSAAQMIAIRLAEAAGDTDREQLSSDIFAERFLIKRPLLQALEPDVAGAPVLLIDELDRADEAFEAYLLEILSDFQVTIPEFGTIRAPHPPIVIITSNRTREIHDALKRRCLYHWVDYPEAERELAIVKSRVPGISAKLSQQVVHFVQALREQDFYKSPWCCRDHRLGHRADRARRPLADAATGRRHARRAAEIPGRHRAHAGRYAAKGFEGRDERLAVIPGRASWREPGMTAEVSCTMTTIDHLNPPTGHMADNVVGFGRALRAAGIPVGPGAVIDALDALQAIEIGNRADVYATLEAIFVKRHEHMLIFAQAFDLFFRAAEDWK